MDISVKKSRKISLNERSLVIAEIETWEKKRNNDKEKGSRERSDNRR